MFCQGWKNTPAENESRTTDYRYNKQLHVTSDHYDVLLRVTEANVQGSLKQILCRQAVMNC